MKEDDVVRELSHKTGLPESTTEAVLNGLREMVHAGALAPSILAVATERPADPRDPRLVDEVIARARQHPLGLEFLLRGFLPSVAAALGAHAFTIEAARARFLPQQPPHVERATR